MKENNVDLDKEKKEIEEKIEKINKQVFNLREQASKLEIISIKLVGQLEFIDIIRKKEIENVDKT